MTVLDRVALFLRTRRPAARPLVDVFFTHNGVEYVAKMPTSAFDERTLARLDLHAGEW